MTTNVPGQPPAPADASSTATTPSPPIPGPSSLPADDEQTWRRHSRHQHADGPEWAAWTWASGRHEGRTGVSWLGVLLALLGIAFLINQVNRSIDVGSMLLLGVGLAFGATWLIGGWRGATVPALVLTALGGILIAINLGYVTGSGWTPLALGVALVVAWAIGLLQKRSRTWALWVGLILAVYGFSKVAPQFITGLPDAQWFGPAVLIVLGVALLIRRGIESGPGSARN